MTHRRAAQVMSARATPAAMAQRAARTEYRERQDDSRRNAASITFSTALEVGFGGRGRSLLPGSRRSGGLADA